MNDPDDPTDDRIERAFRALRARERASAPEIRLPAAATTAPAGRSGRRPPARLTTWATGRRPRWILPMGLAAATAALIVVGRRSHEARRFETVLAAAYQDASLGTWSAPTDALLEFTGREFYREVPRLGVMEIVRRNEEGREPSMDEARRP